MIHFIFISRFSVDVYFFILMGIMLMSFVAFILINTMSQFASEMSSESSVMIQSRSMEESRSSSSLDVGDPGSGVVQEEEFSPRSISPVLRNHHQDHQHQQEKDQIHLEKREEDLYLPVG